MNSGGFFIIIIIIVSSSSSSSSSIVVLDTTRMKTLMSLRNRTAERKGVTVKRLCVTNVTGLLPGMLLRKSSAG